MIKIEKNKSSTYFLPIFNKIVPIKYFYLLKNTYFWYDDISKDVFCLLFKFDGKITGKHRLRTGFTIYEQDLRNNVNYLGECDYEEYVVYMFSIPEELIELKIELLNGEYSKISDKFKKIIIEYIYNNYSPRDAEVIRKVLYKDPELRKTLSEKLNVDIPKNAELSSIIDIEKELFSNYVINKKRINYESKNNESRNWNPWTNSTSNESI